MRPSYQPTSHIARRVGELCLGGDWACAHGDVESLGFIVEELAGLIAGPGDCALGEVVQQCRHDPEAATARWAEVKDRARRAPR